MLKPALAVTIALVAAASFAAAQTTGQPYAGGAISGDTSATVMWGVTSVGSGGATSAGMHVANGISASHVNAARRRALLPDNITIQSIGSQTIVSVTVYGNNNAVETDANQTSNNSGNVSNTGVVNAY